jgi:hypothetical protein
VPQRQAARVKTLGDNTRFGTFGVSACALNVICVSCAARQRYAECRFPELEISVSRRLPLVVSFVVLALWLAAVYGVRYGLMEDVQWVGACADETSKWQCSVRSNLGLLIHFGVFGWGALIASAIAFFMPHRIGRVLAGIGLLLGILALVLYTASLAVFAVVIAGLRLVRAA